MPQRKILFGLPATVDQPNPTLDPLRAAGFTVERVIGRWALSEDELIARLPGVCATIAGGEPYTERVFAAAPDLKLVARHGAGYEKVDLAAATRHGVAVTVTPGANANAVADMTLALMGAVRRNLLVLDRLVRAGGWGADTGPALWRSTVGIVGLGYIGKAVARRCVGFEMRLLAAEPAPDLAFVRQHGITLVDVDALCRQADIITLHAPATPENRYLINRERLAMMKPTAILINTGRGTLVDEAALCEALSAGRLAGAGLDVFEREPPEGSPLLTMESVVLTPHCAGRDLASHAAVLGRCVDTILRFFRQEPPASPEDLLNPEVLPRR